LLFSLCGCGSSAWFASEPTPPAEQPDLLLFLVAGLRADAPGEEWAEAAFYQGLARAPNLRFESVYAQSITPFLSMGSLLTGRYPSAVPMCGLYNVSMPPTNSEGYRAWCSEIPEDRTQLSQLLGLYGYERALVTHGVFGDDVLAEGFEHWIQLGNPATHKPTPWAELQARSQEWWAQRAERPRLLVVVTADPLLWIWADNPDPDQLRQAYVYLARQAGLGLAGLLDALDVGGGRQLWAFAGGLHGMGLTASSGFPRRPIHPTNQHNFLLERCLRVPLALLAPRGPLARARTQRVRTTVELVDLLPTIANLAQVVPPAGLSGDDLLQVAAAEVAGDGPRPGQAYAQFGDMRALRAGGDLLTYRANLHNGSTLDPLVARRLGNHWRANRGNAYSLHDVEEDYLQERDLVDSESARVEELWTRMVQLEQGPAAPPDRTFTDERLFQLRKASVNGYW